MFSKSTIDTVSPIHMAGHELFPFSGPRQVPTEDVATPETPPLLRYFCNDAVVTKCSLEDVLKAETYVAFYRKIEENDA